jgi:hypothetical protein
MRILPFFPFRSRAGIALFLSVLLFLVPAPGALAEEEADGSPASETNLKLQASKEALSKLKLPGIHINLEEWAVDVQSTVCLHEGMLEFIACSRDKEHESIIAVKAAPSHIHTALLLLGAKPGRPAHQKAANEEKTRWIPVAPSGHPVDVSLVVADAAGKPVERPISEFIAGQEEIDGSYDPDPTEPDRAEEEKFPTNTFLFAGSIFQGMDAGGKGKKQYLADLSGSVISLSTFGDELLCLPGIFGHGNDTLRWSVDPKHLPKVGEKVTLRLRPKRK